LRCVYIWRNVVTLIIFIKGSSKNYPGRNMEKSKHPALFWLRSALYAASSYGRARYGNRGGGSVVGDRRRICA
jgi:hypothetical protein